MQEVTRLYGIRESGSEEATAVGSRAWEQLRYHLQEIIHPLLTSKYTVATSSGRPTLALPSPIFGSPFATSFQQWLTSWECSLVEMLKGERASQVSAKTCFALRSVLLFPFSLRFEALHILVEAHCLGHEMYTCFTQISFYTNKLDEVYYCFYCGERHHL